MSIVLLSEIGFKHYFDRLLTLNQNYDEKGSSVSDDIIKKSSPKKPVSQLRQNTWTLPQQPYPKHGWSGQFAIRWISTNIHRCCRDLSLVLPGTFTLPQYLSITTGVTEGASS